MFLGLLILIGLGAVGIHFAATANARKIQAHEDPYPYEVISKEPQGDEVFIEREDGTRIRAVASVDDGAMVVLAHGYGATLISWNILWDRLVDAGYKVIAFDLRGHGKSTIGRDGISSASMASDFKAVLDHFDVRDGVLLSHSTGGFLSCLFQLTYPETVAERLIGGVFAASLLGDVNKGSPQNRLQIPLIKTGLMNRVARSDVYGWSFGASLFGDHPYPAGIKVFTEKFAQQPHKQLIPILEALAKEEYYSRLGEITLPTVVVCGREDKTTPPWHSETMGKNIPNARNVWVDGVGHAINWEAVDVLFEAIESLSKP